MIADKETAREVNRRLLEVHCLLNDVVVLVCSNASIEESTVIKKIVGRILGELLLEIVNPLYREHPDLKPDGLYIPKV